MKKKQSYSKSELFHAWVHEGGLKYYNTNKGYNCITGIDNILYIGDKTYMWDKKKNVIKDDFKLSSSIKTSGVISIIDRDRKRCVINRLFSDHAWKIKQALPGDYEIFEIDEDFMNLDIMDYPDTLMEACVKYKMMFLLEYSLTENKLVLDKVKHSCNYVYYIDRLISFKNWFKDINKKYHITKMPFYKTLTIKINSKQGWINSPTLYKLLKDKEYTDKERKYLRARDFYSKYVYGNGVSFKEIEALYDTVLEDGTLWQDDYINQLNVKNERIKSEQAKILAANNADIEDAFRNINIEQIKSNWYDKGVHRATIEVDKFIPGVKNGVSIGRWIKTYVNSNFFDTVKLRIYNGGRDILTSKGASVPFVEAAKLYKVYKTILKLHTNNDEWEHIIKNTKVGLFTVNRIVCKMLDDNKEIAIIIGCHTIYDKDIQEFINYYKLEW